MNHQLARSYNTKLCNKTSNNAITANSFYRLAIHIQNALASYQYNQSDLALPN